MSVFPKRPHHAQFDYVWDEEENEPFLGVNNPSGRFIKEEDFPDFHQSSKLEKSPGKPAFIAKLIMALLTAVILGACIRGVVGNNKQEPSVCTSPACIHASSDILYNLDPDYGNIDPCTNFDQYVCGGWMERHDLRSDQAELFSGDIMAEQAQSISLHILDKEESENSTARCPGESIDDKNFCKAKAVYDACMDEATIEEKGTKPLQKILDKVVELFPVEGGKENRLAETLLYFGDIGVEALVSLAISADDRDPDNVAIFVTPPTVIGLPSMEYYNDTKTIAGYKKVVGEVLGGFKQGQNADSKELAQDVVDFETKLAEASPSTADSQDITKYYNPLSVSKTEALLPQISIKNIISSRAPEGFKTDLLIVGSPSYMESLSAILKETPDATVQAFLKWKVIQKYVEHIKDPVMTPLRRFNNQLQGKDPDAVAERWRQCVDEVDVSVGWILSRLFLQEAFSEDSKKYGNEIVADIKARFVSTLKGTEWMSKDVRDLAIEKVGNIVQKIGFPTKSPNIKDPEELQKYYETLEISNNTFFANSLAVSKFDEEFEWAKLGKPTDRDAWGMTIPTVNAYYNPPGNEIVFPAGIMQAPVFYDSKAPKYLTYGAFGAVAGHELTHAFDSTGRHYDEIGNYTNWWDNKTIEAFKERTSCFVDQYSKFSVPGPDGKPLHVDGELTLGENVADAGGVKAAFQAWKKHDNAKPDPMLPGLDSFTKEKLFFISFSGFWCSKSRKEAAIERMYSDEHALKPFRILGPMANSREFREAFDCPVKEPTCELW